MPENYQVCFCTRRNVKFPKSSFVKVKSWISVCFVKGQAVTRDADDGVIALPLLLHLGQHQREQPVQVPGWDESTERSLAAIPR